MFCGWCIVKFEMNEENWEVMHVGRNEMRKKRLQIEQVSKQALHEISVGFISLIEHNVKYCIVNIRLV